MRSPPPSRPGSPPAACSIELVLDPADGAGVSWLHRHTEVIRKAADEKTGRIAMTVRVEPEKAKAVREKFAITPS